VQEAAEAVREVVSMAILTQVRDPRVQDVTVTRVEVAPDMRSATVHVSVMGSPVKQETALRGLASSAGFLQSQIAAKIDTRYTPRLSFKLDGGVKHSIEIARMLDEVLPAEPAAVSADTGQESADAGSVGGPDPQDDPQEKA
jgi:ribosome-binding factor A